MANAINLQELEQELTRTRGMFEHWSAGILTRAQECNSSHISKLRAGKGRLALPAGTFELPMLLMLLQQCSWQPQLMLIPSNPCRGACCAEGAIPTRREAGSTSAAT
jgi:hypothetical protein